MDPEVKIEVTFPLLSAIAGILIGTALWVVVATPYLIRGLLGFLVKRMSFHNPLAFVKSTWEVLMTPIFDPTQIEKGHDASGNNL